MKIQTSVLEDFLSKIRMNDVEQCLLQFKDEGLYVSVFSPGATHQAKGLLKKSAFVEYAPIGKVGVDELGKLIRVIKRVGTELEFDVEGNLLTAKGKNKLLELELVDEKFIDVPRELPDMKHNTSFKLDASDIAEFIKDITLNKDTAVFIETVDGGVKLFNTGKYKFTHNINSDGTKAGEKVKIGEPFLNVFDNIKTGVVDVNIKSDFPLEAKIETEAYNISFLIAPLMEGK